MSSSWGSSVSFCWPSKSAKDAPTLTLSSLAFTALDNSAATPDLVGAAAEKRDSNCAFMSYNLINLYGVDGSA